MIVVIFVLPQGIVPAFDRLLDRIGPRRSDDALNPVQAAKSEPR
jgi:hypothetical protein